MNRLQKWGATFLLGCCMTMGLGILPWQQVEAKEGDHMYMTVSQAQVEATKQDVYDSISRKMIKAAKKTEDGTYAIYNVYREEQPNENISFQLYRDKGAYKKHLKTKGYAEFVKVAQTGLSQEQQKQVIPLMVKENAVALYTNGIGDAKVVSYQVFKANKGQEAVFARNLVTFAQEAAQMQAGLYATYVVQDAENSSQFSLIQVFANASTYQYFHNRDVYKQWVDSLNGQARIESEDMLRARVIENKGGLDYLRKL